MDSAFKFLNSIPSFYLYYERKYNNCQVTKVNFIKKLQAKFVKFTISPRAIVYQNVRLFVNNPRKSCNA